jgi:chromosome segregation ATPase
VQNLTKENNKLNSKVITLQIFKDTQSKKRNMTNNYRYPSFNSYNRYPTTKRLVPTPLIGNKKTHNKDIISVIDETETESIINESTVEHEEIHEEIPVKEYVTTSTETDERDFYDEEKEKLKTLSNTYRSRIERLELELEREKNDKSRIIEDHESELLKEDIERISMQKDISDKTKKILEYKRKNEELSGKYESIKEAFEEASKEIENINNNYKEERKKRVEAEEK